MCTWTRVNKRLRSQKQTSVNGLERAQNTQNSQSFLCVGVGASAAAVRRTSGAAWTTATAAAGSNGFKTAVGDLEEVQPILGSP